MDENMEGIINEAAEFFLSSESSAMDGLFGNPELLPRVGDQYQAEVPALMVENECLQLIMKPTDTEVIINFPNHFSMGLPIPVMWIHNETGNIKDRATEPFGNQDAAVGENSPLEAENSEDSQITSTNDYAELVGVEEVGGLSNSQSTVCDKMDIDLILPQAKAPKLDRGNNGYHLVPGSLGEVWGNIEYDCFLLGLYIFGKNLSLVKRFVESKKMGDILAHYYGKFYKSSDYRRWSECRKMRSRRYVYGQKIFTSWRQQELLSRLFTHVSEEFQNVLMEVSRAFGEGDLTLEEYVFRLKDMVGLKILVEAVAIGKGKQDLTGTTMEPIKTNHLFHIRPEIPSGKACSSLTCGEIIKLLTGDFRLSKARSNDIFWEAVWPRLLARGWHSEQPRDHGCAGSRHSLVFLVPGVKKFSRWRLEKGNHYFDSVTDVLNKVASEPAILEIEMEAARDSACKEEYRSEAPTQDPEILSKQQRHCYLQPRNSGCNQNSMKFTIVDTSLFNGEDWVKVRELRSLPVDPNREFTPSSLSCETEQGTSEEDFKHEVEENNASNPAEVVMKTGAVADSPECVTRSFGNCLPNAPDPLTLAMAHRKDQSTTLATAHRKDQSTTFSNDSRGRVITKLQFSRKSKSRESNYLDPIMKQHHLTACRHEKTSNYVENISLDAKLNREKSCYQANSPDTLEKMAFHVGTSLNASSSSSLAGNQEESMKEILNGKCPAIAVSPKKPDFQTKIDLNLPHSNPVCEGDEPFAMNMVHDDDHASANKSSMSETSKQPESLNPSKVGADVDQQPVLNGRRQSTRNRPLTTRALEALAFGFLETKRKRKGTEAMSQNIRRPTSSQRVHRKVAANMNLKDGAGHGKMDGMVDQGYRGNNDMVDKSHK